VSIQIVSFEKYLEGELRTLLREYLDFAANVIIEEPWKFSINIEKEIEFTFEKMKDFTPPNGDILVAFSDEQAVGTASIKMIRKDVSELKRMYVKPKFQGQLIGQKLLERLFKRSEEFGAKEVFLDTPPPFEAAHKLYLKNGFELFEEYPELSIPDELKPQWVYMRKLLIEK
tara:strand:+ start:326 stop:841 length:516 start_codon:yes stop_codon:yes gene_type:complete